jgi:site-specific DNA-methyltransferase (adenine-specific)
MLDKSAQAGRPNDVDNIALFPGDMLAVLPALAENSIDSCVTDAPYHLTSIVKRFGGENAAPAQFGSDGRYARASAGFMGQQWDGGNVAFRVETWREVLRVLKPGAHLLAFGGTRTFHRMACAIEDAGFEIRDTIFWLYGSGFPKSHDVSKGIDRAAGAEREVIGRKTGRAATPVQDMRGGAYAGGNGVNGAMDCSAITAPATLEAAQWQGWGTALKPACEPIILARKPLAEGTVAANVLRWGTGALNIDGCRVGTDGGTRGCDAGPSNGILGDGLNGSFGKPISGLGRWPANVIHDGSDDVTAGFPETGISNGRDSRGRLHQAFTDDARGRTFLRDDVHEGFGDCGSAARFFYTSKADSDDRLGSRHPTVKPLDLIQYLVRLVTPLRGIVLDPFAGSGTTGEAAFREGMRAVLIEREDSYCADIRRRMALVMAGPGERAREAIKERMKDKPADHGPLFAWDAEP